MRRCTHGYVRHAPARPHGRHRRSKTAPAYWLVPPGRADAVESGCRIAGISANNPAPRRDAQHLARDRIIRKARKRSRDAAPSRPRLQLDPRMLVAEGRPNRTAFQGVATAAGGRCELRKFRESGRVRGRSAGIERPGHDGNQQSSARARAQYRARSPPRRARPDPTRPTARLAQTPDPERIFRLPARSSTRQSSQRRRRRRRSLDAVERHQRQ